MRWVVGLLLVAAALLKAIELILDPATVLVSSRSTGMALIQTTVELGLGLLVLSGPFWSTVRPAALVLFASFSIYSLFQAVDGAASCGCFGPVNVSPWWTFLLDIVVVLGLIVSIIRHPESPEPTGQNRVLVWLPRQVILVGFVGFIVVSAAIFGRYVANRTAFAGESLTAPGGLVILEPETWIGKRLPIADAIKLDLSHGNWIVLLHRHDCPQCQEAVPKYEELAQRSSNWQIALLDVPPCDGSAADRSGICHYAQLSNDHEWFVQTPVEIQLDDGIVTSASHDLLALAQSPGF